MESKLDILVIGAHPDDVELGAGGLIAQEVKKGKKIGIIDLTAGELGTRGTKILRALEAQNAGEILGITLRKQLNIRDGWINPYDEAQKLKLITAIRTYQPTIIIGTAPKDRHPDHANAHQLITEASFLAGLRKIATVSNEGMPQQPFRPQNIFYYMQFLHLKPDFIYDISDVFDLKLKSIQAHTSQFFNPESDEPETLIASKNYFESITARAKEYGMQIGVEYGEPFFVNKTLGLSSLDAVL